MIALWACLGLFWGVMVNWIMDVVPMVRPQVKRMADRPNILPRSYLWIALYSLWTKPYPRQQSIETLRAGVELALIITFPLVFWLEGAGVAVWHKTTMVTLLFLIALIDLKYRLVLNPVLVGTSAAALLFKVIQVDETPFIQNAVLGGCVGLGLFILAGKVSRSRLGGGDIKLAFVIGFIFGYPHLFWPLILGTTIGVVQGLGLLAFSPRKIRAYAFAPALCLGTLIALFLPI